MPQPLHDPIANGFAAAAMFASIASGVYLLLSLRNGPLLRYEARRPVPWGAVATFLAGLAVVLALFSSHGNDESHEPLNTFQFLAGMSSQLVVVGSFLVAITLLSNASWRDLGLPSGFIELTRDALVGGVACLAALAPVFTVQTVLMGLLFPKSQSSGHPLIKMMQASPTDTGLFVATAVVVIIVAPVCEEIVFRLLLQGWLEKVEDAWLGWRFQKVAPAADVAETLTNDARATSPDDAGTLVSHVVIAEPIQQDAPPRRGVFGLPYGSVPICISAVLFGLAHFGYGPEPVPISMLGLVLGYLYQRKHRIAPSIVAHALFNSFSVFILWRIKFYPG